MRHELDTLARFVGNAINERNCKRVADYRGIAQLVYSNARDGIAHDASPFDGAPPGIAADGMFFHLNGAGVERTKLLPKHLARFAVPVTPDEKHPRPLFDALIEASFPASDHDHEEQRALLQKFDGLGVEQPRATESGARHFSIIALCAEVSMNVVPKMRGYRGHVLRFEHRLPNA